MSRDFSIDETGSTVAMAREYARATRGERVSVPLPRNYGGGVTIIGARTVNGLTARTTLRSGTTKQVFRASTEHVVVPELRAGDGVVSDDLAAHKDPEVRALVEVKAAKPYFLPPYSSDPNPIERAWAWTKWWLRTRRARSEEGIDTPSQMAVALFTRNRAAGRRRECGCAVQPG